MTAHPASAPGPDQSGPAPHPAELNTRIIPHLLAALFFLGVAALVTWPALPRAATTLRDAGDPALFVWTLHWLASAAVHDPAQLYAGPIFHGFPNPITYTDTSLLPGLLLAPLWLSDSRVLFFNLLMWVTLALLGFSAYLLIRVLSGSSVAGVIGGLVCGVNSYTLAHLSHLNLLSAYWLPIALLALHRLWHPGPHGPSRRAALVLILALLGQTLSTFYVLAYLLLAVGAYVAWQALGRRAAWDWPAAWRRRLVAQLLLAALLTGATLAVISAPYRQTQQVMGFARTRTENLTWSAQPLDYLSVSLHNRTYARLLPHQEVEPLFAGFLALLLAAGGALGAFRAWGRRSRAAGARAPDRDAAFYGILLLLGVLLSFGPELDLGGLVIPMPYQGLAFLPGASALRAPVRAVVLVNLSLGVFAGLGLARILAWRPRRPGGGPGRRPLPAAVRRAFGAAGLAGLVALMLLEQQVAPLALANLPASAATLPAVYGWLAGHPDGGVLIDMSIGLGLRDTTVASTQMYYQTWHGHPLVSGYSGFLPPGYVEIAGRLGAGYTHFTAEQLGILQSLDVRYILYHQVNYKSRAWAQLTQDLGQVAQVQAIGAFPTGGYGDDYLYRLDARPAGAVLRIAVTPDPAAPGLALVQITNSYAYPLLSRLRPTLDLTGGQGRHLAVPTPLVIAPGSYSFRMPLAGPPPDADTVWTPQAPAPGYLHMTPSTAASP